MSAEAFFTFPNTREAIAGEKALLAAGLSVKVMPMPEALSHQCGICLRLPLHELEAGRLALAEAGVSIDCAYQKEGEMLHLLP